MRGSERSGRRERPSGPAGAHLTPRRGLITGRAVSKHARLGRAELCPPNSLYFLGLLQKNTIQRFAVEHKKALVSGT